MVEQQTNSKNHIVLPLVAIIIGVFMAVLDTSIVNVALPNMMNVFGVGQNSIQWVVTAYTLTVGSIIPVTGFLGERFGYKRVFITALIIFTFGSALCGAAWSNGSMVFFRIIQALGGGAIMPVSMAMITRLIPKEKRGFALGIFGIAIMFAPAIGPTLSGYITEYMNWRLIFYLNVPIGIFDFFLASVVLENTLTHKMKKFDIPGFIFSVVGFSTLLYSLGEVPGNGWASSAVLPFLVTSIISLTLFVIRELSVKDPMLDLRLLKNWSFAFILFLVAITSVMLLGVLFILPIYLENLMGFTPFKTGLILLPQALVAGIFMPIAGIMFDRIGIKPLAGTGFIIMGVAMYLMTNLTSVTAVSTIVLLLMFRSAGIGITMMPLQTQGLNLIPDNKEGQGTAILNAVTQISNSFGVAWLSMMLSQRSKLHIHSNGAEVSQYNPHVQQFIAQVQHFAATKGLTMPQGKALALKYLQGMVQLHSTVQAMDDIFYILAIIAGIGAVITFSLRKKRKKRVAARVNKESA